MDIVLFVETLAYVLVATCVALTALAVVFLAIRPLLDPHWKDASHEAIEDREAAADRSTVDPASGLGRHGMASGG